MRLAGALAAAAWPSTTLAVWRGRAGLVVALGASEDCGLALLVGEGLEFAVGLPVGLGLPVAVGLGQGVEVPVGLGLGATGLSGGAPPSPGHGVEVGLADGLGLVLGVVLGLGLGLGLVLGLWVGLGEGESAGAVRADGLGELAGLAPAARLAPGDADWLRQRAGLVRPAGPDCDPTHGARVGARLPGARPGAVLLAGVGPAIAGWLLLPPGDGPPPKFCRISAAVVPMTLSGRGASVTAEAVPKAAMISTPAEHSAGASQLPCTQPGRPCCAARRWRSTSSRCPSQASAGSSQARSACRAASTRQATASQVATSHAMTSGRGRVSRARMFSSPSPG
ncbi:MAG: hypothetical protein ACLQDY_13585 [Streptosporangiaceae bacterium]